MSKATLEMVIAPHAPTDQAKLASLVAAYDTDREVPPVTILRTGAGCFAVCGSHRIAAALEIYEAEADVEECLGWTVLDGSEVYEAADETTREMLDCLFSGRGLDFDDLAKAIGA